MKFTPGNWTVYKPTTTDMRLMVLHPDGSRVIASLDHGYTSDKGTITNDERQANAQLIAAAPELFTEHATWAKLFGAFIIQLLQGDIQEFEDFAREAKIDSINGEPHLHSEILSKYLEREDADN